MAKKEVFQTVSLKPFTGAVDDRSSPEDVPLGAHRAKVNFTLLGLSKLSRRPGDERLMADFATDLFHPSTDPHYSPRYTNPDYHDHDDIHGHIVREAVTLLFEAQANTGQRFFYLGTQSKLKWLNETTGMWIDITTGKSFGGTRATGVAQTRWKAAELQEQVIFTNDVDKPQIHTVGSTTVASIPELSGGASVVSLNVTKAKVVVKFGAFILLMNLEEDGVRKSSRIRWCDLNRPTVWIGGSQKLGGAIDGIDPNIPAPPSGDNSSLADFQDLDYGEDILAAAEMGNALYIYTTRRIWRANIGTDKAFNFVKVYSEPENQAKCLFFENTLVSTGTEHWYAGSNGIYRYSPFIPEPERVEWLYRGSASLYSDNGYLGDVRYCASPVAKCVPNDLEIHLSWPETGISGAQPGANTKTLIWNYDRKSPDIKDHGYSAFCNYRPSPLPVSTCRSQQLFVGASTTDWCLKQIGTVYSRERCVNASTGAGLTTDGVYSPFPGLYVSDGYYSILRGLLPFQNFDREKTIKHLLIEAESTVQASPCVIRFRIGTSYSQCDPNDPDGRCSVIWRRLSDKELKCLGTRNASKYQTDNLRPALGIEWAPFEKGRFMYYEITIANADGSPAIGGACSLARMEVQVKMEPKMP